MKNFSSSELLLIAVIIARSSSNLCNKIGMRSLETFNLLALRFGFAGLLLLVLFSKKLLKPRLSTVLHGLLPAATFTTGMVFELWALKTADTATVAFLECAGGVVLVPTMEMLLRRKLLEKTSLLSILLAVIGIAFMTLAGAGFSFSGGVPYGLAASAFMSTTVLLLDRFSKTDDALTLGMIEVMGMGIFSTILTLAFDAAPHLPESAAEWASVLTLAIVCTGFSYTLQPVAQKGLPASRTAVLFSLSPVFTMILGMIFLREQSSLLKSIGMLLIMTGVLLPVVFKKRSDRV